MRRTIVDSLFPFCLPVSRVSFCQTMHEWAELLQALKEDMPFDFLEPVFHSLKPRLLGPGRLQLELADVGLMPVASRLERTLQKKWRSMQGPEATLELVAAEWRPELLRGAGNAAAMDLAEKFSRGTIRSLYIQGGPGRGKTALLRSLKGHYIPARELPRKKQNVSGPLLLDDFDLLRNYDALAEWISKLLDQGQPVCLAGRHFPDGRALSERLQSRIESMPRARLGRPDEPTCFSYYERLRGSAPDLATRALLSQARNFRDIERIAYQYHFPFPESPAPEHVAVESIQEAVADQYRITTTDLLSSSRRSEFIPPRQVAMYLAANYSGLSKSAVARAFRRSDHSTVIHACQRVQAAYTFYEPVLTAIANKLRITLHIRATTT